MTQQNVPAPWRWDQQHGLNRPALDDGHGVGYQMVGQDGRVQIGWPGTSGSGVLATFGLDDSYWNTMIPALIASRNQPIPVWLLDASEATGENILFDGGYYKIPDPWIVKGYVRPQWLGQVDEWPTPPVVAGYLADDSWAPKRIMADPFAFAVILMDGSEGLGAVISDDYWINPLRLFGQQNRRYVAQVTDEIVLQPAIVGFLNNDYKFCAPIIWNERNKCFVPYGDEEVVTPSPELGFLENDYWLRLPYNHGMQFRHLEQVDGDEKVVEVTPFGYLADDQWQVLKPLADNFARAVLLIDASEGFGEAVEPPASAISEDYWLGSMHKMASLFGHQQPWKYADQDLLGTAIGVVGLPDEDYWHRQRKFAGMKFRTIPVWQQNQPDPVTAVGPVIQLVPDIMYFFAGVDGVDPADQMAVVNNIGSGVLVPTLGPVQYFQGSGWLNPSILGNNITVSIDTAGMGEGTYQALVPVLDPNASNSPMYILVVLTLSDIGTMLYCMTTVGMGKNAERRKEEYDDLTN